MHSLFKFSLHLSRQRYRLTFCRGSGPFKPIGGPRQTSDGHENTISEAVEVVEAVDGLVEDDLELVESGDDVSDLRLSSLLWSDATGSGSAVTIGCVQVLWNSAYLAPSSHRFLLARSVPVHLSHFCRMAVLQRILH